ncbi:25789_t:CDS:1, partial [Racocetra persica]
MDNEKLESLKPKINDLFVGILETAKRDKMNTRIKTLEIVVDFVTENCI